MASDATDVDDAEGVSPEKEPEIRGLGRGVRGTTV